LFFPLVTIATGNDAYFNVANRQAQFKEFGTNGAQSPPTPHL